MANEKRLIDAFTLAEEIESLTITVAGKPARWNDAKHSVLCVLAEQPDVDAVEVVRCKDCYFWHRHTEVNREYGDCFNYGCTKKEDGFCDKAMPFNQDICDRCFCGSYRSCDGCSYGERKDNEI